MLAHLPIIILTAPHPSPVADAVPNFNIARECQFEGGTQEMQQRCAADETQARDQLLGLLTLSYITARNPRIDLGYAVRSGYAYWPLRTARIKA